MTRSEKGSKYNVMLITVDSLRADFLGMYNPEIKGERLSPNIDSWAEEACVFSRALSQAPHTSPSFLAILSGNYPSRYGDWWHVVSDHRPMMAEIFKENGYGTYAFNSNPYISRPYNFNRGFDLFRDNMPEFTSRKNKWVRLKVSQIKSVIREPYVNARNINSQVFPVLRKAEHPFVMWVHYMDLHGPYVSKRGWKFKNRLSAAYLWRKVSRHLDNISDGERAILLQCYREEIAYLDRHIADLLGQIDYGNTIVIFTADHGDLFGEHGLYDHPLRLYNKLLHVPLIVRLPDDLQAQRTRKLIETPVRSMDIVPTLIDILDLGTAHSFNGLSFLSLMKDSDVRYRCDYILSEASRKHVTVEKFPWKLIVDYTDDSYELYNLSDDPEEEANIFSGNGAIVEELEAVVKDHLKETALKAEPEKEVDENEELKSRLRALGYLD